ncbi:hypothetical protein P7C73_g13, partial [Tremellales sp. Uapishka_1]
MPAIRTGNTRSSDSTKSASRKAIPEPKLKLKVVPREYQSPDPSLSTSSPPLDDEESPEPTTEAVPELKVKGRKGKAGGPGKKGKVFMEDKTSLLSLVNSMTSQKDQMIKERIDKAKPRTPAEPTHKEPSASERKKKERARALREAKKALVEKAKAKKRASKGGIDVVPAGEEPKKRVGFA